MLMTMTTNRRSKFSRCSNTSPVFCRYQPSRSRGAAFWWILVSFAHGVKKAAGSSGHHFREQSGLRIEVMVDRALGHSGRFDQRGHRSTGVAISRHHTGCSATLNYSLSKRTMVYAEGVYQRANSGAQAAINGIMDPSASSSSASQAIAGRPAHRLLKLRCRKAIWSNAATPIPSVVSVLG